MQNFTKEEEKILEHENSLETTKKWKVVSADQLPVWLQNSTFIFNWYRPPLHSHRLCWWSLFRIHTETGNIWTHLLAGLLFIGLLLYFSLYPTSPSIDDQLLLSFYLACGIFCWFFSTYFHTVRCHSKNVHHKAERLDYCGILFYSFSAFLPVIYYIFLCDDLLRYVYMGSLSTVGFIVLCLSQCEMFGRNEYRVLRAMIFSSLSLVTVLPVIHALCKYGIDVAIDRESLHLLLAFCIAASAAILVYSTQFPESIWPGKFDLWLHSHQLFHVLAVVAGVIQLDTIRHLQKFSMKQCNS